VGQDGVVKKEVKNSNQAFYDFQENDTYIRTKIDYGRTEFMLLNPVFRYHGDNPLIEELPSISWWKTILFRGAYLIFFILILRLFLRKNK
jgi:hypothetical protein